MFSLFPFEHDPFIDCMMIHPNTIFLVPLMSDRAAFIKSQLVDDLYGLLTRDDILCLLQFHLG